MTEPEVDLTNCDREPIHIPGSIQPQGVLLVLEAPTLKFIQVSNNSEAGLGRSPEELLGNLLSNLLDGEQINVIGQCDRAMRSGNAIGQCDRAMRSGNV